MLVAAWGTVIVVTVLRLVLAWRLPLTGDEAYYWEWSRRLAAGYIDHPPAVAYAIALFAWVGRSPFAVRVAFVLCGFFATLLCGLAARELCERDRSSDDGSRACALAMLAVTLAPIMVVAFGIATPDGPYALAWAASLYCAIRFFRDEGVGWALLLGLALGAALLARFFGLALLAGIVVAACAPAYRGAWRRGLPLSLAIAAAIYAPFLWWNAQHHWIAFAFALVQRHPAEWSPLRPFEFYAFAALAFSPGLWIAATLCARRRLDPILAWTALPLALLFFALAIHERVQTYWFVGPYLSLCVAIGTYRWRSAWIWAPAAVLSAVVYAAAIAPFPIYHLAQRAGLHLADAGPFEMFTYPSLASDLRGIAGKNDAVIMTDGYGFSSLIDFYGGLAPVVIGYDAQGQQARRWFKSSNAPPRALFVDKVPFATRPDFERQFALACGRVVPGPTLRYNYRDYYTTWCDRMDGKSVAMLRWQ